MAIKLSNLAELGSRIVRNKIGERKLPSMDRIGEVASSGGGGGNGFDLGGGLGTVLGAIWGGFSGFLFLVGRSLFGGLAFTFSGAWSLLVQTGFFLTNFDWNASDDEIDAALRSRWTSWAGTLGTGIGGILGWFACGVLPNAMLFSLNPAMAIYVLEQFGEEAQEEMAGYIAQIVRQSANATAASMFANSYKSVRSIIKAAPGIRALIPNIDRWGAKDGPTFTIASAIEDQVIDKIPNPMLRAFANGAYEEFFDACIEAGFVLTAGMDGWVASQANKANTEKAELIEIKPNREGSEIIHLAGSRAELKATIPAVIAQHQIIRNRDVGDVYEMPLHSVIQVGAEQDYTLHLKLNSNKTSPFYTGNSSKSQEANIVIPWLKPAAIDWDKIRRAIGLSGYQYGKCIATVKLSNGRQFQVYAATTELAEAKAKDYLQLTRAELTTLNVTTLTNEGDRASRPELQKSNLIVYPYKAKITRVLRRAGSKDKLRSYSFPLWTDQKPQDWLENIQRLQGGYDDDD